TVDVKVTVKNDGALGVAPGVPVDVFVLHRGRTTKVGSASTTTQLLPGETETLVVDWKIPRGWLKDGFVLEAKVDPDGNINECEEQDNASTLKSEALSVEAPELAVKNLSVASKSCRRTGEIRVTFDAVNEGDGTLPKGVPIEVTAEYQNHDFLIVTVTTDKKLPSGASDSFDITWRVDSQLVDETFDVRAVIDPDGKVFTCETRDAAETSAACEIGS
ncbi:MAG: CARDB domain-containing protein, partial [Bradymonadaceae bacterium]